MNFVAYRDFRICQKEEDVIGHELSPSWLRSHETNSQ